MENSEKIAHLLERMGRLLSSSYNADGFKPVQWEALSFLSQANVFSRNPSALGKYLGVTKGSISQTLSILENRGLLSKRTDKKDKRAVRLDLTAKGRAMVVKGPLQQVVSSIDSLGTGDQQDLLNALEKVLLAQLDERGRQPFGQCKHCTHHRHNRGQYRCNLLGVALEKNAIELICVEYEPSDRSSR